ncbi:hypothetical protein CC2G_002095 [Coprinopsis cinerea AmutBmut pab1-1]|nr:hypothetical protein CC2G_002095 [Coprinopsis cinerea AmutBmut pab1-1]
MPPVDVFHPSSRSNLDHHGRPKPTKRIPYDEDDEYTLSSYGDIPRANTLFVPTLPSPVSKKTRARDERPVTPPPRNANPATAASASPLNPSPTAEFLSLPNYGTIVARLKKMREHVKAKEESVVQDRADQPDHDDARAADTMTKDQNKRPETKIRAENSNKADDSSNWLTWSLRGPEKRPEAPRSTLNDVQQLRTARPIRPALQKARSSFLRYDPGEYRGQSNMSYRSAINRMRFN